MRRNVDAAGERQSQGGPAGSGKIRRGAQRTARSRQLVARLAYGVISRPIPQGGGQRPRAVRTSDAVRGGGAFVAVLGSARPASRDPRLERVDPGRRAAAQRPRPRRAPAPRRAHPAAR